MKRDHRDTPTCIYAVRFLNGSVKIGYTIDLRRRLVELAPVAWMPQVITTIENTLTAREDERLLHYLFRDECLGNECFRVDPSEVVEVFRQLEYFRLNTVIPQGFTLLGYRRKKLREYGLKYWVRGIVEEVAARGGKQGCYEVFE